ncbi:tail fiber domain-containing protein [Lonsdalea quercina]|uniref:tail fiber domain-containing protein n=1 Tax=Lonsdalea quercina TaxID=71657 RepID=UPI00397539DD
MSSGTIALTNNSSTVTGTSTSFSSNLSSGDFIVTAVGGVTYTLPVKTVDSGTQVTLIKAYDGPTTSGAAWNAVPRDTMSAITAQLAAETAKALRGLNYDKANWQQVFSGTGNITVMLPDGSTYTGPAWNGITSQLSSINTSLAAVNSAKLGIANNLSDVADKSAARSNLGVIPTSGGNLTGPLNCTYGFPLTVPFSGDSSGYGVCKGVDNFQASYQYYISSGNFHSARILLQQTSSGNGYAWTFRNDGNAYSGGSWVNGSDERHKTNIKTVENALESVISWRGCTYDKKDGVAEVGLIAQDVEKSCPSAVSESPREFNDGTMIEDFKYLNTAGAAAAYHTEAIKNLLLLIEESISDPQSAMSKIQTIKNSAK